LRVIMQHVAKPLLKRQDVISVRVGVQKGKTPMFRNHCCRYCTFAVLLLAAFVGPKAAWAQLTAEDIQALKTQGEREDWTFEVGENDATKYPLKQLCGLVVPDKWWEGAAFNPCTPNRDLPAVFDWRDNYGVTPVRSQGWCGSCWAFATVGPLESAILIKDRISVNLSEQWLVSCNQDGWGCNGGWWAHDYFQWKTDPCGDTGAVLERNFPYAAADLPCDCPYVHEYLIDDWAFVGTGEGVPDVSAMKQALLDYGPLSVAVYVNSAFQAYNHGVFNGCGGGEINHGVTLVGWDDDQGPAGVWFIKNSWGTGWGEQGYMRIPYNCSSIGYAAAYVDYPGAPPSLTFQYPNGIPELLAPGIDNIFRVNIYPAHSVPEPGTGCLYYSVDGGAYIAEPLVQHFPNQYDATFPAADCYTRFDFYFSAETTQGDTVYDPAGAPSETYMAIVATGTVTLFDDDFETDQGWSVQAGAATGNWERADPQQVESGGLVTQPEDDHTAAGTECYVTDGRAGSGVDSYDVDGGPTHLTSPVLNLAGTNATVSYWRWYHISSELDNELVVEVSNDDGSSWVTAETVAHRETWTFVRWFVSDYVTPTAQVRVRFTADDTPNNSLVEALVDDFKVEVADCPPPEQYTLTVNVDGNGWVEKDPNQATYADGQPVVLTAHADSGWSFDHWSGDLEGSASPVQITMDTDKTITAHFVTEGPPPDCPEDLYTDGVIDLSDLGVLLGTYGLTPGDPGWNPYADFDGNNVIDLSDLGALLAVYGETCPTR
jgi:hypothetical protein